MLQRPPSPPLYRHRRCRNPTDSSLSIRRPLGFKDKGSITATTRTTTGSKLSNDSHHFSCCARQSVSSLSSSSTSPFSSSPYSSSSSSFDSVPLPGVAVAALCRSSQMRQFFPYMLYVASSCLVAAVRPWCLRQLVLAEGLLALIRSCHPTCTMRGSPLVVRKFRPVVADREARTKHSLLSDVDRESVTGSSFFLTSSKSAHRRPFRQPFLRPLAPFHGPPSKRYISRLLHSETEKRTKNTESERCASLTGTF